MDNFVCACSIAFVYSFGVTECGCSWKGEYNTFSPHAAICMLFMKIKIVRGLANNEIIRTVEFITTLCKLLLSSIIIWLLIVVQGHIVLHI